MTAWVPGFGVAIGLMALLVIAIIVITGHCAFDAHVGLGLH